MPRSSHVTIAAIVAFLGSLLVLLVSFQLGTTGQRLLSQSPFEQQPFMQRALLFVVVALAGHGVWGAATAAGLFRRKGWARVSVLFLGSVLVFFGAFSVVSLLLLQVLIPESSGSPSIREVSLGLSLVYGSMVVIGIWWLILFTRRRVKGEFQPLQTRPVAPIPTSVTIVAWYLISTGALLPFFALLDWPAAVLGVILTGWAARIFNVAYGLLWTAAGFFLLRRKKWALGFAGAFLGFLILNAMVFAFLPHKQAEFKGAFLRAWSLPAKAADIPESPIWVQLLMWAVFAGIPLFLLWTARKRYLEACCAPVQLARDESTQV